MTTSVTSAILALSSHGSRTEPWREDISLLCYPVRPGATKGRSILHEAEAEVLRGVGAAQQQRRVARHLTIGLGSDRLHPHVPGTCCRLEPVALLLGDRVDGAVVEHQQHRTPLAPCPAPVGVGVG